LGAANFHGCFRVGERVFPPPATIASFDAMPTLPPRGQKAGRDEVARQSSAGQGPDFKTKNHPALLAISKKVVGQGVPNAFNGGGG